MVEERWNEQDRCANIAMKQTDTMAGQRTPLMRLLRLGVLTKLCTCTVCIRDYITKMESKNCKRLKRDDDGVRDGGEGNVTACLVAPLLEEQIPGTETCSYEGFEFTAALFLS